MFHLMGAAALAETAPGPRLVANFDFEWQFHLGDAEGAQEPDFDDGEWKTVDLPHDWSIEGEYDENHPSGRRGGFLPTGTGWYRKHFNLDSPQEGRRALLEFGGIYLNSDVWINGQHLGHRPNGYVSFAYDLTEHLIQGENVIAVRIDHEQAPTGRWYTGSGIYRHVKLILTDPVRVAHWGTHVTTPDVTDEAASVQIETMIENADAKAAPLTLETTFISPAGDIVAIAATREISITPGDSITVEQSAVIPIPHLWSPDTPNLYRAVTRIYDGRLLRDEYETTFGVRTLEFSPEWGFKLNGRRMKLKGMGMHHDGGPVGAAVPQEVLERRLRLLKAMGCNAVRTAHNPQSPEFYDLCDRIGLMVMNEAFDGWETVKARYDYGRAFEEWWQRDLSAFVRRDRNHPCVIMWSVGNEVRRATRQTQEKLVALAHELDPTRPVTQGFSHLPLDDEAGGGAQIFEKAVDIIGLNGVAEEQGNLEAIGRALRRSASPKPVVATEAPHTYQTRGVYLSRTSWRTRDFPGAWEEDADWRRALRNVFPIDDLTPSEVFPEDREHLEHRQSSYDNATARISARQSWQRTMQFDWLMGQFTWISFDYLGESYKWPARMHSSGVLDLLGFPKDHYYLYKSLWTDEPMVHLLPHWTHEGKQGTRIPVVAYTNCESVELFLNGTSLGKQKYDGEQLVWQVPYEPGELRALARRDDFVAATAVVKTAGEAAAVEAKPDRTALAANRTDCVHLEIGIVDEDGVLHPYADDLVTLRIDGPARLIGFDNGDPLDLDSSKVAQRRAFRGKCLAILQSTGEPGEIVVTARAEGLQSATLKLTAVAPNRTPR